MILGQSIPIVENETSTITYALVGAAIVGGFVVLGLLAKWMWKWFEGCWFCSRSGRRSFRALEPDRQQAVLDYYRRREHRQPDTSRLQVCPACTMVLDEFSRSYERREFSYTILRHFCKGCGGLLDWVEDGDEMQFVCEGCGMVHTWQLDDPSGFIFLAPPEGTLVLAAPPDD